MIAFTLISGDTTAVAGLRDRLVVMVVVTSFASVLLSAVKAEKQTVVSQRNALIAPADVQTVTVVVAPSSPKKLLLQKQLLKKLRRIRRRKLLKLQLKPNFGFTQHA